MTVTLGGIVLSEHLVLTGLENAPPVAYSQKRTIGGKSVVAVAPVAGGRTLTLQGENHYTLAQIEAVQTIAQLGAPVTLVHHRGTFSVLITSIEVDPTTDYANPGANDWYNGTITLLEV